MPARRLKSEFSSSLGSEKIKERGEERLCVLYFDAAATEYNSMRRVRNGTRISNRFMVICIHKYVTRRHWFGRARGIGNLIWFYRRRQNPFECIASGERYNCRRGRDATINQRFDSKANEERCLLGHQNTALQFDELRLEITTIEASVSLDSALNADLEQLTVG